MLPHFTIVPDPHGHANKETTHLHTYAHNNSFPIHSHWTQVKIVKISLNFNTFPKVKLPLTINKPSETKSSLAGTTGLIEGSDSLRATQARLACCANNALYSLKLAML